ncbi:MAG: hypothetical protein WCT53_01975 [Candidatus Gracilibacteria bacterium]
MLETIINYSLIVAYIGFTSDLIIQTIHVIRRKSSRDISIKGFLVRIFSSSILLVKYVAIYDLFLLIGQAVFIFVLLFYFVVVLMYRRK